MEFDYPQIFFTYPGQSYDLFFRTLEPIQQPDIVALIYQDQGLAHVVQYEKYMKGIYTIYCWKAMALISPYFTFVSLSMSTEFKSTA